MYQIGDLVKVSPSVYDRATDNYKQVIEDHNYIATVVRIHIGDDPESPYRVMFDKMHQPYLSENELIPYKTKLLSWLPQKED